MHPRSTAECASAQIDAEPAVIAEHEAYHRVRLVLLTTANARPHGGSPSCVVAHPRSAHRAGNEDRAGGVDFFRFAVDELAGGGLHGARLLVGKAAADCEPIP